MSKEAEQIFNSIVNGTKEDVYKSIQSGLENRYATEMEIQKVKLTASIFNQANESTEVNEAVNAKTFVKGGSQAITQDEVEGLIATIYDDSGLTKELIKAKAYREGEANPKKKNPYREDTVDFHIFQLAQQIEMARS
jgi:hypothetical protein